jgi:hypothetical protein
MSPAEVAECFDGQVSTETVLRWIASGELPAENLARDRHGGRPTWWIEPADLEAFRAGRRQVPQRPRVRRHRRVAEDVVRFF